MNRIILAVSVIFASSFAVASCPKGTEEYQGRCASMPSPEESTLAPMIPTSNEKVPSDKMPSYERAGVHADTPDSLVASDIKADREHMRANIEGKKKAHIPLTDEEKAFDETSK